MRSVRIAKGRGCAGEALNVRIAGRTIADVVRLNIEQAYEFFRGLELTPEESAIADKILVEIRQRVKFLNDVGSGVSHAGPFVVDAVGRGSAAHPVSHLSRIEVSGRVLCAG